MSQQVMKLNSKPLRPNDLKLCIMNQKKRSIGYAFFMSAVLLDNHTKPDQY